MGDVATLRGRGCFVAVSNSLAVRLRWCATALSTPLNGRARSTLGISPRRLRIWTDSKPATTVIGGRGTCVRRPDSRSSSRRSHPDGDGLQPQAQVGGAGRRPARAIPARDVARCAPRHRRGRIGGHQVAARKCREGVKQPRGWRFGADVVMIPRSRSRVRHCERSCLICGSAANGRRRVPVKAACGCGRREAAGPARSSRARPPCPRLGVTGTRT